MVTPEDPTLVAAIEAGLRPDAEPERRLVGRPVPNKIRQMSCGRCRPTVRSEEPREAQRRGCGSADLACSEETRGEAEKSYGQGASPLAIAAMPARVYPSRYSRICGAGLVPDAEQHALTLVVTGAVLVRLAEVAERDRAVDGRHDVGEQDLLGRTRQDVAAADAALRADETGALEGEQDLLEIRLRQGGAIGDVANRRRSGVGVQRE